MAKAGIDVGAGGDEVQRRRQRSGCEAVMADWNCSGAAVIDVDVQMNQWRSGLVMVVRWRQW